MPRKEYYQANKDELNAKKREQYKENKEQINEYNKQWQRKNRDVTSRLNREYQHRLKESDPCKYYTENTWRTLNQRCVNGIYANSPSIKASPQMFAYHKKNIQLELTKEELTTFWYDNEVKVKEILLSGGIPSIDRMDDDKNYSIGNIQVLDRKENIHKSKGHSSNPNNVDKQKASENNRRSYQKSKKLFELEDK